MYRSKGTAPYKYSICHCWKFLKFHVQIKVIEVNKPTPTTKQCPLQVFSLPDGPTLRAGYINSLSTFENTA